MNAASAIVLTAVVALAALAVRRCLKKGMPCECGCDPRNCPCRQNIHPQERKDK